MFFLPRLTPDQAKTRITASTSVSSIRLFWTICGQGDDKLDAFFVALDENKADVGVRQQSQLLPTVKGHVMRMRCQMRVIKHVVACASRWWQRSHQMHSVTTSSPCSFALSLSNLSYEFGEATGSILELTPPKSEA
ncbi:hypothetical protein TcWFU_010115 [Taenia crassiceps]|uniref:Uncharacterized protein n=1 Tax=Taenia crassiceps TaxID=6207 RepID=A0ABR4QBZ5_9CEST